MFLKARRSFQTALVLLSIFVLNEAVEAQVKVGSRNRPRRYAALLRQGVHVLNPKTLEALSEVQDGAIFVFRRHTRQLNRIMGGDVIVCGASELTPHGMLRRVTEISEMDGELLLRTEQATLEDVFWAGRVRESVQMSVGEVRKVRAHKKGVRVRGLHLATPIGEDVVVERLTSENLAIPDVDWSPEPIEIDLLNVILFDLDEDLSTTDDQVTLSGIAGVQPSFDIDLDIFWGRVRKFHFINTNELYNTLKLEGHVYVPVLDENVTIATLYFNPVVIMAGPVPLVFTPILEIKAGARGSLSSQIQTSVTAGFSVTAGIIYENNRWRGITDFPDGIDDVHLEWDPPQLLVDVKAQAYAGPQFTFLLYGVVGPFASVYGYTELSAHILPTPTWALFAGFRGNIGLENRIPIIGPGYTMPVFDEKWRIAEGRFAPY